jgi:glutaredoxin
MSQASVVIYSRPGCHLCEVAKSILQAHGLAPEEIDINTDPALIQQYGETIPVVVIDGMERFRGRIDEILLRRLLRGRSSEGCK